jgi:hypothetical protein
MKHFFSLIVALGVLVSVYSQSVVEIVQVDQYGIKKAVKTNRPDTIIRQGIPGFQTANPTSTDQPIFRSITDSV